MFLEIGRPSPVPPRLVVKYGSNTRDRSSGATPDAAIDDGDDHPFAGGGGPEDHQRIAARRRGVAVHGVARVDEQVDEGDAQPLAVGHQRRQSRAARSTAIAAPGDTCAAAADSRQSAARSVGARSKRIGREKSRTSLTIRLRRVTS